MTGAVAAEVIPLSNAATEHLSQSGIKHNIA